jgi:peptide-methionine (S)-S-oxide reductase
MTFETATLAAGCFWCIEACFDDLKGVQSVESGYIGGHVPNPTYKQICNGDTGHAEAIRVVFDPQVISYAALLELFFAIHDPTQLNRQGNDVGTQYRSAIFVHSADQRAAAEAAIKAAQLDWPGKIVTTLEDGAQPWTAAEDYHQEYYARTGDSTPYCAYVVGPKVRKFRQTYADRLKGA